MDTSAKMATRYSPKTGFNLFSEPTSTKTELMSFSIASGYGSKSGRVGVCGGEESGSEPESEDPSFLA